MGITILDENAKLRLEMERDESDACVIRPVGVVDEDLNATVILTALSSAVPPVKALKLDLGHVSRMNSCGVREWLLLMERLCRFPNCSIVNANELFVEQANIIPGVFGKKATVKVESFQAPYHCGVCARDCIKLISPGQVRIEEGELKAPEFRCEKCQGPMEFDWSEEEYFSFVKRL
ncbi:MAG: hypothetical protein NDJ89_14055 [Oligoflexia bacterium]|nr:hypothetical protein [Oligoflexia bacterium]